MNEIAIRAYKKGNYSEVANIIQEDIRNNKATLLEIAYGVAVETLLEHFTEATALYKKYLHKVIRKDSVDTKIYVLLATTYWQYAERKSASTVLNKLLSIEKEDSYLYIAIAQLYLQQGNIEPAIAYAQRVIQNKESNVISLLYAYMILIQSYINTNIEKAYYYVLRAKDIVSMHNEEEIDAIVRIQILYYEKLIQFYKNPKNIKELAKTIQDTLQAVDIPLIERKMLEELLHIYVTTDNKILAQILYIQLKDTSWNVIAQLDMDMIDTAIDIATLQRHIEQASTFFYSELYQARVLELCAYKYIPIQEMLEASVIDNIIKSNVVLNFSVQLTSITGSYALLKSILIDTLYDKNLYYAQCIYRLWNKRIDTLKNIVSNEISLNNAELLGEICSYKLYGTNIEDINVEKIIKMMLNTTCDSIEELCIFLHNFCSLYSGSHAYYWHFQLPDGIAYWGGIEKEKLRFLNTVIITIPTHNLYIEVVSHYKYDDILRNVYIPMLEHIYSYSLQHIYGGIDVMTGAVTHAVGIQYIERMLNIIRDNRNKESFMLVFIDVDNFKHINDTYGHNIGDMVLHNLVKSIKQNIRRTDTVVRWGGDEFLLILQPSKISIKKLKERMKKIENTLQEMCGMPITISYGYVAHKEILRHADKDTVIENIVQIADMRMYKQKNAKKVVK